MHHRGRWLAEAPGKRLWVGGVEVGEEILWAEVLEAGSVVGHGVGRAVDVGHLFKVAVVTLMEAGSSAEIGPRGVSGDSAFAATGDCRGVVREAGRGAFA